MIEIIYNKEKDSAVGNEEYFCVPRNVRQIGDVSKENKIYIEDYVYTYLTSDWKEETKGSISILLGKYNWKENVAYVFIKSAMKIENISVYQDHFPLNDETWGAAYEEMKQYFPGQEVVGWYLSLPDCAVHPTDQIRQAHLTHFGGNDKVLLLADPSERECAFFCYKNNRMEKQKGYYIFYEKNEYMQEYMLKKNTGTKPDASGGTNDRAVHDFRKIIERKMETKEADEWKVSWGHVACAGVILAVLMTGAVWMNGQRTNNQTKPAGEKISAGDIAAGNMIEDTQDEENADDSDKMQGMTLLTPEITATPEISSPESAEDEKSPSASNEAEGTVQSAEEQTEIPQAKNTQTEDPAAETAISVYTKYTVRKGDTISKICMRYYGDFAKITEICKINNMLEDDVIYPGQTILLP